MRPQLEATHLAVAPVIDGVLDDVAWASAPASVGEWKSYNPLYGSTIPQQTRVWVAYDARYLYFAFDCLDPEPERIKTSVTAPRQHLQRRLGRPEPRRARHRADVVHMMVNPSGVQLDMLEQRVGRRRPGSRLGLGQRRASSRRPATPSRSACRSRASASRAATNVEMGVLFWRRVSRLGVSVAWPDLAARQVGVRAARGAASSRDLSGDPDARGDPGGHLCAARRRARTPDRPGAASTTRRRRPQRARWASRPR